MNAKNKSSTSHVLLLQGGGALGAYQAGAFEELHDAGYDPSYLVGISIGAINSAIIAGNKPEDRVKRLRAFWERITSGTATDNPLFGMFAPLIPRTEINKAAANDIAFTGAPGFFTPRIPGPFFQPPGSPEAISFYDTRPLHETLEELVDFDILNSGNVRLAVGAVGVESGEMVYFDNAECEIKAEHIMASGALPPGFPPIEIDGEWYWDGGLVSNSPLNYWMKNHDMSQDAIIFQVDLYNSRGEFPKSMIDIENRDKDIRFSSRTVLDSDQLADLVRLKQLIGRVLDKLPDDLDDDPDVKRLRKKLHPGHVVLAQLIYRQSKHEHVSRDYEFSRLSMNDHWDAGKHDVARTLNHNQWEKVARSKQLVSIIDSGAEVAVKSDSDDEE